MLIIFDCDGVLRSASWEGMLEAYIAIIKYLGKDHRDFFKNLEEFKKWWDPDWRKNDKKLGIVPGESTNSNIFHQYYDPYIYTFPWIPDIVGELEKKHTLTILSSASDNSIKDLMGEAVKYFRLIIGYECVKKLKPDPEGINLILEKMNISPSETIMIGDTNVDILAGKNAGTKTGAVTWGLGEKNELLAISPDYLFEKPTDLLSV